MWWYFIFPVILNVILLVGSFAAVGQLASWLSDWIGEHLDSLSDLAWLSFLKGAVSVIIHILLKIFSFVIVAIFGGYIIVIILSPVFSYMSEKTERILSGKSYPFDADQLMRDIVRGVLIALRNMFIETFWMVIAFIVGFIPVIGFLAPFGLFFVSSYFYGFSFLDYTIERRKLTISESVRFMRSNKGVPIGNGAIYALFMLIPYCGVALAGFAAIVSVVAATISVHELENKYGPVQSHKVKTTS